MSFTQENSIALGFGFRCGFLGLLHMEIILERLEREYNLDLITTAPNVVYKITKTDGTQLDVYTPLNYPDPAEIAEAQEPYAKANLIAPPEYVGAIMDLCQNRRGEFKDMQYLDPTRVELHYSMPLKRSSMTSSTRSRAARAATARWTTSWRATARRSSSSSTFS